LLDDGGVEPSAGVEVFTAEPVAVADPSRLVDDVISSGELATEIRIEQGLDPVVVIDPDCTLSARLELGDTDPEVACLESQLIAAGALSEVTPDEVFDEATDAGVRRWRRRSPDRQAARVVDRA